jgi:beta-glucosidase
MASMLVIVAMILTMTGTAALASGTSWTAELTRDGWMKVTQENGPTLGYMPDSGVSILEVDGLAFKDMNKNDQLDPYEDWRLDDDTRAANAAELLTNDEITALLLLGSDSSGSTSAEISDSLKAMLESGFRSLTAAPSGTVSGVVAYANALQAYAESLGIGVPVDMQGEPDLSMATTWPTNIGLSASFDPELVLEFGKIRGQEYRAIGVTSANMPQIDVATEPRWMRVEGTFSEDPTLAADMAAAYVNGLQSTYDAEGNDLGWGEDSVVAYVKHFPGDGAGEGGRESHHFSGQYTVQPGGNMNEILKPFIAAFNLEGKTESAAGVMPSYSISLDQDGNPLGGENVGSGYSKYKITELLRGELGFDGVTVTDYGVLDAFAPWGAETLSEAERCLLFLEAGMDKGGSYSNLDAMKEGVALYGERYGQEALRARLIESAVRIVRNTFRTGLFENPYMAASESAQKIGTDEQKEAAQDAQAKSVVMLKNSGNLIHAADEKLTVYIPLEYSPATEAVNAGPFQSPAKPASFTSPIDIVVASKYFNVVTDKISDTYTGAADESGNPTLAADDVIRASAEEIAACDFVLAIVQNPMNVPASMGKGYNEAAGGYIPVSLQYGPYTADSEYVRQVSISGDILENGEKENRSYYGKSAVISNTSELDKILDLAGKSENVLVVINTTNPMIVAEFESEVEGILMHFGNVEDKVLCEIIAGQIEPSALLPFQMPANMETVEKQYEDVPHDMECHVDAEGNTYDFAYGLNWSGVIQDERVAKYKVAPLAQ